MATFLDAIYEAARLGRFATKGTCSSTGTTTTLIDDELIDHGVDVNYMSGAWIYRPDAAAAGDTIRRVPQSGFTVASGTLTIDRAWTNAPTSGETYYIFSVAPPFKYAGVAFSWADAVNRGLDEIWIRHEMPVGRGDNSRNRRFQLATVEWPLIVILAGAIEAGASPTITSGPAGFTEQALTLGGDAVRTGIYTKPASAGDSDAYELTLAQATAPAFALALAFGNVRAFGASSSAGSLQPFAYTETDADELGVAFWTFEGASNLINPHDDMREEFNLQRDVPGDVITLGGQISVATREMGAVGSIASLALEAPSAASDDVVSHSFGLLPAFDGRMPYLIDYGWNAMAAGETTLRVPRPSFGGVDEHIPEEGDIRGCFLRSYLDGIPMDTDMEKLGRWWRYRSDGRDRFVELSLAPTELQTVYLDVNRPHPRLDAADDELREPVTANYAGTWGLAQMFGILNGSGPRRGKYVAEQGHWEGEARKIARRHVPSGNVRGL